MNINVRGKHIEVTDALREYVEKRVGKLEKYFDSLEDIQVTLLVEKDRHRVEVTAPISGMILRGEEETTDMYSSIDLVVEKLEKQINKYKTRLAKKIRETGVKDIAVDYNEFEHKLIRNKKFAIKPMDMEEAIMQMNLVGHSFYVFANAETEEINVVYRRKDGNYGLIEPDR
ncbi:MAG TPA: ribosome-associated translation inhibitor RaiA [Verrucomicrobiae bacterium]|nr:ribosome-associated translation inhibitor RaiA [Verrucomicrobiae bacterium]